MSADSYFSTKRAAKRFRSGHCGIDHPLPHTNCHGGYNQLVDPVGWIDCCCSCHQTPAAEETPAPGLTTPVAESDADQSVGALPATRPQVITYPELIQGSEEWLKQRRGMLTASVIGQLVTPKTIKPADNDYSRALTALLVAERITGYTDPTFINDDMWRGIEDEPRAIEKYAEHYAPVTTVGFMVRDDWGFQIGYSPDGLVGEDGLVEVKSRRQKKHLQTILSNEVPLENMAQLQCGLLVSGREWVDYISYCGGMPLWVKRVTPNPRWHAALVGAAAAFELAAEEMVGAYRAATKGLPATERVTELEMI